MYNVIIHPAANQTSSSWDATLATMTHCLCRIIVLIHSVNCSHRRTFPNTLCTPQSLAYLLPFLLFISAKVEMLYWIWNCRFTALYEIWWWYFLALGIIFHFIVSNITTIRGPTTSMLEHTWYFPHRLASDCTQDCLEKYLNNNVQNYSTAEDPWLQRGRGWTDGDEDGEWWLRK